MIRRTFPRFLRALVCALSILAVVQAAGCAGGSQGSREKTAREWYDEGAALAARKKYDQALEAFAEAARGYRDADLDADIQIALADASFGKEEYAAAVEAYTGFLRLHPHHARADYAQYQVGLCWQKQMRGAERSQEASRKAASAYEALLRGYPRSSYLEQARAGLAAARRRLAEHELSVADFYVRTERYQSAAGRFEAVLRDYPDAGLGDRALFGLGRCYRRLRQDEQAERAFDQLRREYPQSPYLKDLDRKG